MGGRYQTTQVERMGCSFGPLELLLLLKEDAEPLDLTVFAPGPSLSPSAALDGFRSKPPPGVLGVFVDDPNDAKAPDPRPNADDALAEGEGTFVERGDIALKGFERPMEPSNRLDEWPRGESDLMLVLSLPSDPDMDRESLLEKNVNG